jgi:murein DD-endopeptidase MepM/ murein hydrolase activator NlpD
MRVLYLFLIFYTPIFSQTNYPKEDFTTPLDIPMQLSGNFGELRPNHFHTGLDLKTQQREGLPVYAIGDGYISRIKISPYGYGKAIYIDHPNGYTSVYGHLQKGYGKIEAYIKAESYKQQSGEIEIFPKPGELPVRKCDTIAFSGNTGGSEGPHLHFEIRDTKSEKIINPLYFGYDLLLPDTKKPLISALVVYPIDENSVVNQSKRPVVVNVSLQPDGTYIGEKVLASGKIGFGITGGDYDNVSYNNNGIFKVQSYLNGSPAFGYEFQQLVFDQGRFVNAFIDYPRYRKTHVRVQQLFMKNPFPLGIITTNEAHGIIDLTPNLSQLYRIEASDYFGNKTILLVPIDYSALAATIQDVPKTSNYLVKANTDSNFEKGNMSVFFPAHTFYEDFYMNFDVKDSIMTVHDDAVPVHSNFLVTIKDSLATNVEKTFIGSLDGKRISYNATKFKNNTFTTYTKNLGQFTLAKDTTPPKITIAKPIEGKWLTAEKAIALKISDDISGIRSYNGYINGKWVLFEYDNKTKKITHYFDDAFLVEGKNDLKVVVSDNLGNSAIFETTFFRSQKK